MIFYYTDGSCKGNGQSQSYGAHGWICYEDEAEARSYAHAERDTTNQRQELLAIISACKDAAARYSPMTEITIVSDSAYAIGGITQHWYRKWLTNGWLNSAKQAVANRELWEALIPFCEQGNFHFVKTTGHAADKRNNAVDDLVQTAAEALRQEERING